MEAWENRLRWHCRRGLLEMDLLLQRFLDRHLAALTASQREALERLLEFDDIELLALAQRRKECSDPQLAEIVGMIAEP